MAVELLVPRGGSGLMRGLPMRQVLHSAGVRVHEAQPGLWHTRMCLIDGAWVGIGSTRLDWRNAARDAEAGIAIFDPELAAQLERVFREDIQRNQGVGDRRTRPDWQHARHGAFNARP
ncbi:MAG: phospholipase D-like domain-containing protein [Comamonadaceae bacterium]|nr:phospholipase D-like domain-containing protein [Comamonadaceae bacterium]